MKCNFGFLLSCFTLVFLFSFFVFVVSGYLYSRAVTLRCGMERNKRRDAVSLWRAQNMKKYTKHSRLRAQIFELNNFFFAVNKTREKKTCCFVRVRRLEEFVAPIRETLCNVNKSYVKNRSCCIPSVFRSYGSNLRLAWH